MMMRGPFLLTAVGASVLLPVLVTWSNTALLQMTLLLFGLYMVCYDLLHVVEYETRTRLLRLLNATVLDDVLRAIHDPDTGIISNIVGMMVGSQTMYSLRLNEEQRTELVQASLWTSHETARGILLRPGGVKQLLPTKAQEWLLKEEEKAIDNVDHMYGFKNMHHAFEEDRCSDSQESEDECWVPRHHHSIEVETVVSFDTPTHSPAHHQPEQKQHERRRRQEPPPSASAPPNIPTFATSPPPSHPTDPMVVLFSIMKELAREQIKPYLQAIPESALESIGASGVVALLTQLVLRRRARHSLLGTMSALALTGVSLGAFSSILARQIALGNVGDTSALQSMSKSILLRMWHRVRQKAIADAKWKGILAMLVLAFMRGDNTPKHRMR